MSFISIHCPNCAGNDPTLISENQYHCKYCDNTFNYVDPNAPKITKNVTVQETHTCLICGRGIESETNNRCMKCGTNGICNKCVIETSDGKLICKNCLKITSDNCLTCNKYSTFKCPSCIKLHEKDPSRVITRYCSEHLVKTVIDYTVDQYVGNACYNCGGLVCPDCSIRGWNAKCKNCGKKLKFFTIVTDKELKKENKSFAEWFTELSELAKSAQNKSNP